MRYEANRNAIRPEIFPELSLMSAVTRNSIPGTTFYGNDILQSAALRVSGGLFQQYRDKPAVGDR
jgi:hypothetical protein